MICVLCRLDNDVGTGVHLTPTGVEFDERRLTLGKSTEVSQQARCSFRVCRSMRPPVRTAVTEHGTAEACDADTHQTAVC